MAHSTAAAYRNVLTGVTDHTVTFSTVLAHETLVVFFGDRTGGAVINSIADSASGTWTQRSTFTTGGGTLTRLYVREDAAAATNLVVTIVTNVSQNSQVCGIRIATDVGGVRYPTYDNVATVVDDTSSDVDLDSNTCALSANGCIVGAFNTNTAQGTTPTLVVGDSIAPAGGAGVRSFFCFDAQASSGNYGFQVDLSTAGVGQFHVISFIDSAAAGGGTAKRSTFESPIFNSRILQ